MSDLKYGYYPTAEGIAKFLAAKQRKDAWIARQDALREQKKR